MFKVLLISLLACCVVGCSARSLETAVTAAAANTPLVTARVEATAVLDDATAAPDDAAQLFPTTTRATTTPTAVPLAATASPAVSATATAFLQKESISPTTESIEELIPTMEPPTNPAIQQWIAQAEEDLAGRLDIAAGEIEFVSFEEKYWPNPGMGCPQPDMQYKQVPVDGYLIRLRAGKQIYNYHGGGGRPPFLCESKIRKDDTFVPSPGFDT